LMGCVTAGKNQRLGRGSRATSGCGFERSLGRCHRADDSVGAHCCPRAPTPARRAARRRARSPERRCRR
jgi:hypothetical protein